jgi:hypothetical protein
VWHDQPMLTLVEILIKLIGQTVCWFRLAFRSTHSIMAENLFLRRQLALYVERSVKSRRVDSGHPNFTGVALATL